MNERDAVFLIVLVFLGLSALLYLDWRRQGEIELLHERVDTLDRRLDGNASGFASAHSVATPKLPVESTVERILHASDDRTLADIARERA